jgi:PAS domain S-box-containing protein
MVRKPVVRRSSTPLAVAVWLMTVAGGLPGIVLLVLTAERGLHAVIAAVAATFGLAGLASAFGLHRLVTSRLGGVQAAVQRLDREDFTRRSGAIGGDEISSVLRALDDLGDRLERRRAVLHTAERRYRLLYEHGPAALFRMRLDGQVVDCNLAAVRMLGYDSVVDAVAHNAAAYYADPREHALMIERLRRHGVLANLPLCFRRKDGTAIAVRLTLVQTQEGGETHLDAAVVEAPGPFHEDDAAPDPAPGALVAS